MKTRRISILILIVIIFSTSYLTAQDAEPETDTDDDGMPDDWETSNLLNPNNSSDAADDNDNDGMTNLQEYGNNTDPHDPDTDGDGMTDGWELQNSFDPLDDSDAVDDADYDSISNLNEFIHGTNPHDRNDPIPIPSDGNESDDKDKDKKEETGMSGFGGSPVCILIFIVPAIVILLMIIFVYTKMRREQLLEHKVRSDIYEYITKNPGAHYRGIMTDLDLHMGVLTHHLNMLEQQQFIKSYQDGMYRRFCLANTPIKTGLILSEVQEQILRTIQSTPGISQAGIARNLNLKRMVVSYHIKILSDAGFVHTEQDGRESRSYYLDGLDRDDSAR